MGICDCIVFILQKTRLYYFETPVRKMFYTFNKLLNKYFQVNQSIKTLFDGFSSIFMTLLISFISQDSKQEELNQSINLKVNIQLFKKL